MLFDDPLEAATGPHWIGSPPLWTDEVENVLRRRGHLIVGRGDLQQTLVPLLDSIDYVPDKSFRFRRLFADATFRKVARMLTAAKGQPVPLAKLEGTAGRRTQELVDLLVSANVAEQSDAGIRLSRLTVDNIGLTLECYVADVCRTELRGSAEWGVVLEGLPTGGDFDVVAWLSPLLVYIECKSSHPGAISVDEIRHFLQRRSELSPELAIFLVDTDSNLGPLIDRFTQAMLPVMRALNQKPQDWCPETPFLTHSEAYPSVWYGFPGVHVTGTKLGIEVALRRCLQHYHQKAKGRRFWGNDTRVNWVTGSINET